jgi:hypothetical protein
LSEEYFLSFRLRASLRENICLKNSSCSEKVLDKTLSVCQNDKVFVKGKIFLQDYISLNFDIITNGGNASQAVMNIFGTYDCPRTFITRYPLTNIHVIRHGSKKG